MAINSEEISKYFQAIILGKLKLLHENLFVLGIDNNAENQIGQNVKIQWIYDDKFNRLYLYYELPKYFRYCSDPIEDIYYKINCEILNNFHRDFNIWVEILDPVSRVFGGKRTLNVPNSSCEYLRPSCFSYWLCNGSLRFLENDHLYNYIKTQKFINKILSYDALAEFEKKVYNLNQKYNFNNSDNVKKGFDEYKSIYYNYFKINLNPTEESIINKIYINLFI